MLPSSSELCGTPIECDVMDYSNTRQRRTGAGRPVRNLNESCCQFDMTLPPAPKCSCDKSANKWRRNWSSPIGYSTAVRRQNPVIASSFATATLPPPRRCVADQSLPDVATSGVRQRESLDRPRTRIDCTCVDCESAPTSRRNTQVS
jgi:hypothetical protein